MRTLVLLAALLLVAFQARAQDVKEKADQVPAQDQLEAEDQDMAITFTGDERLTREASAVRRPIVCTCRRGSTCGPSESYSGTCTIDGLRYVLCCR